MIAEEERAALLLRELTEDGRRSERGHDLILHALRAARADALREAARVARSHVGRDGDDGLRQDECQDGYNEAAESIAVALERRAGEGG